MNYDVTLARIANCYYNLGLERAKLRDLSGAAELLKKSLQFNKYQKDARNLLGLIFFECGETADALVQWVISMNLLPDDNIADHYLDEIQRKPAILRICSDNVQRYNQALNYAQNNNEDLAIMQLNQVIQDSPNYIKAHILLALLYMKRENWVKAGRSLYKVLKIDRNNPKALVLMDEVKQNTGRKEVEQSRLKNAFSHRKMTDDDVIVPQEVKEISPWMVVVNILIGIILALFIFNLLVLPTKTKALNASNNQELISYTEKLDMANREYSDLKTQYSALEKQYNDAAQQIQQYENANESFIGQFRTLTQISKAYESGDVELAAQLYTGVDASQITDENLLSQYQEIKHIMETSVYQKLASDAYDIWNGGNKDRAAELYALSIALHEDPENMYYLARIYKTSGRVEEANILFDKIIGSYPSSDFAEKARTERGY
ncbi:tetratricopeptide repeat protein [Oribacterium sp. WCC10]|uniref:tetratricopeptide repeat protein n=1 Tax=Oribacterium sp. WCC10 TaxID=1855343 RepID=UPI0008EE04C0|nr:tetratricopeptide repeat protein [Oribacterium sp. WCC10]SFG57298.1 Tetratricopeptide repeat-containing protein [Oribacterium sp. WCC10]